MWPLKTPLITALGAYNSKTARWNFFILSTFDKHDKTQRLAKLKKNCVHGVQSHLKFSKISRLTSSTSLIHKFFCSSTWREKLIEISFFLFFLLILLYVLLVNQEPMSLWALTVSPTEKKSTCKCEKKEIPAVQIRSLIHSLYHYLFIHSLTHSLSSSIHSLVGLPGRLSHLLTCIYFQLWRL